MSGGEGVGESCCCFFFSKTHSILSTVCGTNCVSSVEFPSCVLVMCLSQTHSCKNGPHTRHHTVTGVCVWVCETPLTLAASPISLERVPSGADAVVRAWQVDTLPLTPSLQALIYICVWTQTGSSDFWRKLEKSFFFFLPTYTLLPESSCSWILRCCRLLLPVPRWTLGNAAVSVSG